MRRGLAVVPAVLDGRPEALAPADAGCCTRSRPPSCGAARSRSSTDSVADATLDELLN